MKLKKITGRLWLLAAVSLALAPAAYIGTTAAIGSAAMQALAADPMSLFSTRSPGPRGEGNLLQTKGARIQPKPEDFLGMGPGMGIPGPDDILLADEPGAPEVLGFAPSDFTSVPLGDAPQIPASVPFGASILRPGGFASEFGAPLQIAQIGVPPINPGPPSVVPEPGTWLMMIAGFFGIGSALRARKKRRALMLTASPGQSSGSQQR